MSWKDLDIKLKAELIKLGIRSGIKDINLIRQLYDNVLINDYLHPYYTSNTVSENNILNLNQDNALIKGMIDEFNKNKHNIPLLNIYPLNELSTERIDAQQAPLFLLFRGGGYISNNSTLTYGDGGPIKRKRENSLDWRMAIYNAVDPRTTVKNIGDAFRLYNAALAKEKSGETSKNYTLDNTVGDLTTDAAWRKRLELPYDETLLPVWNGDTVSLSRPLELEIPIDTNLVKDRIDYAQNKFWNDVKSLNLRKLKEDLAYKKSQEELLDALRYTYKTGKPIGVSEYHANSIDPEKVLKDFKYGISPLNVLGRYNIRYDKDENKMYYSDEWDFNLYEWAVPGTSFRIRGAIPLNNKNGGFLFPNLAFSHKFDDGGYTNPVITTTLDDKPKVVQKGTVGWNPFNVFNRNYRGAPIYESENFGDSFRLARIDEVPIFIWNEKAYNTNLKPNPLVEAARAWDTQGDLRKIEFQKRIISNPEGTMEYFRNTFPKGEYKTMNSNWDKGVYIIDDMYKNGALGMPNNVIVKGAKHDIGDLLWDYLNTTNLTYNQKLALMANSYKESMGWTTTKQTNGPAKGYYQMENVQFKNYQKWLKQNKLEDNIINETKYIIDLFENHRDRLITPISANLDIEDVINNYKDEEEAHANNHRSAYVHRGYYTEDALRDWDEGNLDAAVRAMEALFEKAGKPRLEDRQKIAWLLSEMYK